MVSLEKPSASIVIPTGSLIPNLGEKNFVAVAESGHERKMKAQVCDVNKALLSVKRILQAGNRVVFDDEGSFIEDKSSGERMYLEDRGGVFMLKVWVKSGRKPEGF